MNLLIFILVGAVAGWLAGLIFKGRGLGFLLNLVVGVVGGFLGGWLIGKWIPAIATIGPITLGSFITAVLGAICLLWIVSLIKKK